MRHSALFALAEPCVFKILTGNGLERLCFLFCEGNCAVLMLCCNGGADHCVVVFGHFEAMKKDKSNDCGNNRNDCHADADAENSG